MDNENTFNNNNNSINNNSNNTQNFITNRCCICNTPISQNEKLCENCKSIYGTSKSSNNNNNSTTINNQNNTNNQYNQINSNPINNNTIVCNSCGSIINKNQAFCNYCGASISNVNYSNQNNQSNQNYNSSINNNNNINYSNGYNAPNNNPNYSNGNGNNSYGNGNNNYATKKSIKDFKFIKNLINSFNTHKQLYIGVTAGVIILLIAITLISNLTGYKRVVRNFFDIEILGQTDSILDMVPVEEYFDDGNYGVDADNFQDDFEDMIEWIQDDLEDYYGDNISYHLKFTDEKKLSNSKYDSLVQWLLSHTSLRKKYIGKTAYKIELEYTIKGNDDDYTNEMEVIAIQIHGKWYVLREAKEFNSWYFIIEERSYWYLPD